ncbi:MAG: hypothetical protein HZA02_04915 [Nitrospinae bacterium]|nr:hypothetical protein [Nitrospinota bacterium]
MSEEWRDVIGNILREARFLREQCLNRNDELFAPWHDKIRNAVIQYAPVKLPAFEEIRFASDYFLSKSAQEQDEIDDRIALVSDLDAAVQILKDILNALESKARKKPKAPGKRPEATPPRAYAEAGLPETPAGPVSLAQARDRAAELSLSRRDREELLGEIDRVERELGKADPDWDAVKRTVKYLLDLDRELALDTIPAILSLFPRKK